MKKEINKDLIKFNLERLKGKKVVVNCVTKEQFDNFVDWFNSLKDNNSKHNYWGDYKEESCIKISSKPHFSYCDIEYYKDLGYEIISYEEALLKESKEQPKEDIKTIKLSDFLKENNCYEKFINNFNKEFSYKQWKELTWNNIYSAFVWRNTEEEYEYWDSIDDKWKEIKHKENDLKDFFEDKTEEEEQSKESKEQSKETFEEVSPLDKDEAKLLVEFLQNKINLTKETYERDINRYTSLLNKYQNILKGDL